LDNGTASVLGGKARNMEKVIEKLYSKMKGLLLK